MAANLVVRNVDEKLARALKQRAAAYGRSAEAQNCQTRHREILKAVLQRRPLAEVLASMPEVGEDADFEVRGR